MRTLEDQIFDPGIPFEDKALEVFRYQVKHVEPYRKFVETLYGKNYSPKQLEDIPLVPVELFREIPVMSDEFEKPELLFFSSGTSSMKKSRHHVAKASLYERAISMGFDSTYGIRDPLILAYTPGYNDNPKSSLIYMIRYLIDRDKSGASKFLDVKNPPDESYIYKLYENEERPILLFGAAFGLLDWIEKQDITLPEETIVMETGGMKTHRREMTKDELRQQLSEGFHISPEKIHSEYGMTEMLSQAYADGDMWFKPSPTLRVTVKDKNAPDQNVDYGKEGLVGIFDLANLYSCSFFQTEDLGILNEDHSFQILGRSTGGALRGCNFLIEED